MISADSNSYFQLPILQLSNHSLIPLSYFSLDLSTEKNLFSHFPEHQYLTIRTSICSRHDYRAYVIFRKFSLRSVKGNLHTLCGNSQYLHVCINDKAPYLGISLFLQSNSIPVYV